ncbi:flavodoxin family protein [Sulfitobacter aestuariivivens]|uniref:Flavodoxin family protein n=1 Tax=Sulfitobacter aestuariivivens TaxID=2766981 RepID=A0A927HGE2_9RHOB|nr:flavodoxin family protein [Sulfitobacter aestuariivivens]MBD3665423.1 flavodoxin family protein [Sulfitobacter aestuariivivens]
MSKDTPEICIAFYSRSGHSRRLAAKLAEELNADKVEITAPKYSNRILGYIRAGFDSLRQKGALGSQTFGALTKYRHVILVGPVWTSYPAVPLRALMRQGDALPQVVSIFLTSGAHSPPEKAFAAGVSDLGRRFVATGALPNSAEGTAQENRTISSFLSELQEPGGLISRN